MINEDNISKENGFTVPDSFLDKMYEFTGNGEEGGFILAYVNSEGRPMVNCKISSQIIEMGLRKALERFLEDMEMDEKALLDNNSGETDPDLS